jgi:hypothetical protein
LAQRKKLIAERDTLQGLEDAGTIGEKDAKRLTEVRGKINDKSRLLGETAADEHYKGAERVYPKTPKGSTSGDFDRVYKVGDEYHVVEAKNFVCCRAVSEASFVPARPIRRMAVKVRQHRAAALDPTRDR